MLPNIINELQNLSNPEQAKALQRFFKTDKGEYGEGDVFLGIKVPLQRSIAQRYYNLNLDELQELLNSRIHEYRLVSLFILIDKYKRASDSGRKEIFEFYLENIKNINNWDLVDLSAPKIVGNYLLDKPRDVLYKLVNSKNLWEKRIAVLSTSEFIRNDKFEDALKISKILLKDTHDLIHKAVGWMLREIGKRNQEVEENFLIANYKQMPRTMLRYALEKFDEGKRQKYLKGDI